jgi:hypothetical protein
MMTEASGTMEQIKHKKVNRNKCKVSCLGPKMNCTNTGCGRFDLIPNI